MRAIAALMTTLVALAASSGVAHAQQDSKLVFSGNAGVGFLGSTEDATIDNSGISYDLDPSIFLSGGIEANVTDWLAVGGLLQLNIWRHEAQPEWNTNFDIDAVIKPRYAFEAGGHDMEAYLRIPIGFTLASVQAGPTIDSVSPGPGFNVGALLGYAYWVSETYAFTVEYGWWYHQSSHNFENPPATGSDVKYQYNQAVLLVGGMFR